MTTTCHRCGTTWAGMRTEHCAECHETFTGTTAGDKHRTGDHDVSTGPNRRRCRTPDEMRAKGMAQNSRGVWMTSDAPSPWSVTNSSEPSLPGGSAAGPVGKPT